MTDADRAGDDAESSGRDSTEATGDAAEPDDAAGDDAPEAGVETVRTRPCPYCGASMRHRHCEYVCPAHGVVMDCSDTFFHR